MKQKKRPFPFTKQARRKKRRACFFRTAECRRTKRKIILRGLTAPGFGKGLGEKNLGGRASDTRAPYLVRQSCRTRRKSNHRSFSAAKVRELSKLFPGKRELHGEKDYTPRLDGARIWQKIRAVERAARVRRTWYGSRVEREESQTAVPFSRRGRIMCQSDFRERESRTKRKIAPEV